ncbi:MAG TPA: hypothetical protein VK444_07380 [Methanobacteriaceae archaeon]|nr:hypothetical protein [Methanobacteriaceae archaeon]
MYHKVNRNQALNKLGHVFERFQFLSRNHPLKNDQLAQVDYHLSKIVEVLNES